MFGVCYGTLLFNWHASLNVVFHFDPRGPKANTLHLAFDGLVL